MTRATPGNQVRASRFSVPRIPTIRFERAAWKAGFEVVAGVDEVGRGAWAGPLVAAAVVLPQDPVQRARLTRLFNHHGLQPRDSKLLSAEERIEVARAVRFIGLPTAIHEVAPDELDSLGLGVANRVALCSAVEKLPGVDFALVDAFRLDDLCCEFQSVVSGDRHCLSIALASIVAKVHRDAIMAELDHEYPGYGFAAHKGYGTRAHAEALDSLGACPAHRRSFRPVAERIVRV